jgi:ABC-type transport system substrate-binding protein
MNVAISSSKAARAIRTSIALVAMALSTLASAQATEPRHEKVLRYAFRAAETGFDPAQVSDVYSRVVIAHIVEGLYQYDHLARPFKITPMVAQDMPTMSEDFKTWTVRIKPGIFFADDPAFKGKKRELVAEDFAYAMKRFADPKLKSPSWAYWDQYGFIGLREWRKAALDAKQPVDYDRPIDGVRPLDRYTIQFRLDKPQPRFLQALTQFDLYAPIAREVAEAYGDQIMAHPVGTGPFKLDRWRRSSLIVLVRNPDYRDVRYDAQPEPDDVEGQALLARFKGRKLPMIDRVEVSIIEEEQPRWLSFLNGGHNFVEQLPAEFIASAMPNGKVAPHLAKRGMQGYRMVRAEVGVLVFNLENPTVGGYTPEKVALRRAINMGLDTAREIRLVRHDQGVQAQSLLNPHTVGFDPKLKTENGEHNPGAAKALLDLYGYVDRNGDGWREMPDGSPLELEVSTEPESLNRKLDELRKKDLDRLGIRTRFVPRKWPENLKSARAGNFMIWAVASVSTAPDGFSVMQRYDGRQAGAQNLSRFKLEAFDALYDRALVMPDGPERLAVIDQANRLALAYAAYKPLLHRIWTDMAHAEIVGYRRPLWWNRWWNYIDIESSPAQQASR